MSTILTKEDMPPDNIFTNTVLRPNAGAYIGEERGVNQFTALDSRTFYQGGYRRGILCMSWLGTVCPGSIDPPEKKNI